MTIEHIHAIAYFNLNLTTEPMKKVILIALMALPFTIFGQNFPETDLESLIFINEGYITLSHTMIAPDNSGDQLHRGAANPFCKKIGDFLKKNYPARITSRSAKINFVTHKNGNLKLTYEISIEACGPLDCDKRAMAQLQNALPIFEQTYGKTQVQNVIASVRRNGETYVVSDYFLISMR